MMKKAFTGAAALLLMTGVVFAQEKTSSKAAVKPAPKTTATTTATCKPGEKGKSCCKQPSKTTSLRLAAATKQQAKKD